MIELTLRFLFLVGLGMCAGMLLWDVTQGDAELWQMWEYCAVGLIYLKVVD